MIRSLRRRFIWGAMLSLFILLVIFIGSLLTIGYVRGERRTDEFMDRIIANDGVFDPKLIFRAADPRGMPAEHMGYYAVSINEEGTVTDVNAMGTWEREYSEIQALVDEVLSCGNSRGKLYQFKYALCQEDGKTPLIILVDNTTNANFLLDTLRAGFAIGLISMSVMFIILLPVSRQLAIPFMRNIEKQKQFITNASHDIKTPIAIIQANIDAMELIQGQNKWSQNIRKQTQLLTGLLKQLLTLARMDESTISLPTQTLELDRFLDDECKAYNEVFSQRSLSLCLQVKGSLFVKVNQDQLSQLLHILMDNAAQYAQEGSSISLTAQKRTTKVRVCLSNTVEQLPSCSPESLFDRFYRDNSSRSSSNGNCGIGLSSARAIASSAHWRLEAQYIKPNTISFTLDLPQ